MAVTYELLETFTGTRVQSISDPDNEGETIEETLTGITDIQVRFTSDDDTPVVHERSVNVCFDADGAYDEAATLVRVEEVMAGVEHKMKLGVVGVPAG
jgi:hypothetical protein